MIISPRRVTALLFFLFACAPFGATAVRAQQQNAAANAPTTSANAAAPAKEEAYVSDKNFRSRIFDIKNRDPQALINVLSALGSGFRGALMMPSRDFRTITVRDFPENIAAIEEAIKRFDVPQPLDAGVELRLHVLIATSADGPAAGEAPEEIRGVIRELQSTLSFKKYHLISSQIHRVKSGPTRNNIEGSGDSDIPAALASIVGIGSFPYHYRAQVHSTSASTPDAAFVQLDDFTFGTTNVPSNPRIRTSLSLRVGEKVVVGTSNFKDNGLIVIVSAKGM